MVKGLVFVHIPKAAGTSLRAVLARHYPRDVQLSTDVPIVLSDEQRRTIRVLVGHVPFGMQTQLTGPVDVITMLRNPVDRVISLYYYIRGRPDHPLCADLQGRSLEYFAASGLPEACNQQVRQISGVDPPSLELAIRHLTNGMSAFGLAERFDESLVLMKQALRWRNIYYRRLNVTEDRPPLRDVSPRAIGCIERENLVDLELYEVARAEFASRVERQGEAFARSLRHLRRFNPVYSAVSWQLHAGARLMPTPVRHAVRNALATLRG